MVFGRTVLVVALGVAAIGAQTPPAKTGFITGVVRDALGEPLVATPVHVTRGRDPAVVARSQTDGEGMFAIHRLPLDGGMFIVHAGGGRRTHDMSFLTLDPTRTSSHVGLQLWDAATLRLRIVDGDGAPVADAHVMASYDVSRLFGAEPQAEATTDAEGRARLDGVSLGLINLRVWKPGFALAEQRTWVADDTELEMRLAPGAGRTLAVVIDGLPEGREVPLRILPYSNQSLRMLPTAMVRGTTVLGRWSIEGLPDLEYRVRPTLEGFAFRPTELADKPEAPLPELHFVAQPVGEFHVHGVLRDAAGKPLAGETIVCRHWQVVTQFTATTDDDGKFVVASGIGPGERTMLYLGDSAYAVDQPKTDSMYGGWDLRFRSRFEFVVDPEAELDVRVVPASRVAGRVVDTDGRPVRGKRVELQEASMPNRTPVWAVMQYATTDRDGHFEFRGLNVPPCDLRVSPGDIGTAATAPFQLEPGAARTDLEIRLQKPGIVTGVVRDRQGAPVGGARVWLRNYDVASGQWTDGSIYEVLSDREGRYRFIDVEPGGHALQLLTGDEFPLTMEGPFDVEVGSTVTMDLQATQSR